MPKPNIKWIAVGSVFFLFLYCVQAAAGIGNPDIRQAIPLTPYQPNDEEEEVRAALQQALRARATAMAPSDQSSDLASSIQSITIDGEWAHAYLQPSENPSQPHVNLATVALLRRVGQDTSWQVALPPTDIWQSWMKEIPASLMDESTKNYLLGTLVPSAPLAHYSGYKLPWSGGFEANIGCVLNNCIFNGAPYHGYAAADFFITGDSYVRAAKGGTVVFRKDTSPDTNRCGNASCWRWSNVVVIRHSSTEYSWYMHLAYGSIPGHVQENTWVEQGSVLGRQGCTGFCTAAHIHFMVATVMNPILDNADPVLRMPNWPRGSYATFDFDEMDWQRLAQVAYNTPITSWNTVGSLPTPTPRPTTQPAPTPTPRPTQPPNPTATPLPTQPPPPSESSIQIVSVSSHTVNPGESFNPSVTMQILSGQLLLSRGDHLHAVPEETTNTLGAWPVQSVRRAVNAGETYTFDVANDAGFRMTAPSSPGTYTSRWQLRVAGNHIGPVVEIPVTVRSVAPPPSPSGWRAQYWNGYYSDNPWGNGRCKADDYTDSIPFTQDWGTSGPGGGCSGERFSVLYERRFDFVAGRYRFHCHRDGYCRIFIPELGLTHAEEAGSFAGMDWGVDIPAGNWEVKIEYSHRRENGNARLEFWWQGPTSYLPPLDADCASAPYEWCGAYRVAWNSPSDSYILRQLEGSGSLDHDWGSSGPGYGIYADFSGEWSRLAKFDAGLYRFHAIHDDGVKISVADSEIMNEWNSCCRKDTAEVWLPAGDHRILVTWFDSGGGAVLKVWWEKITACYDLTITQDPVAPAGQITSSPPPNCPTNDTKYTAGSTVTLSAAPPTGAEFAGWGGDVSSTSASVSLVVDYDKNIVARYSHCQSLQVGTSAEGRIETSPAPSCADVGYRPGATVRVEAIPNAGQQFVRWREDLAGASNPATLLIDANRSVAADYAAIPTPASNAWYGEYFNNLTLAGDPVMVRNDPSLNFSWGNTSPAEPVAVDFSVRWTQSLSLTAGIYRFSLTHDDGMRLWIDGVLHADEWESCCRTDTVDVPLAAGSRTIVVEFVDLYGAAQAALAWEKLETPAPETPTPETPTPETPTPQTPTPETPTPETPTPETPTPEEFSHSIFLPVTLR
jgi:murein DD-endopeptidase MepM/ murein hydrolase activator NlpD